MATDAVKALRRKVIAVSVGALAVALTLIFSAVNLWNHLITIERADELIQVLHDYDGMFPEGWVDDGSLLGGKLELTSETPFETRYLRASFDANGKITAIDTDHIAAFDRSEAAAIAETILDKQAESGFYNHYRYRVFTNDDGAGAIIAVDCFQQLQNAKNLFKISLGVACGTLLVTLLVAIPLSRRFVDPYVHNLERQKRFVADASHELKTPIAIISANTDLIEATEGESQWTRSTHAQTERLTKLTGELMELARADEPIAQAARVDVDLGKVISREIEDFTPLAEASGKRLTYRDEMREGVGNMLVSGRPEELERLASVLLDNAVKYCDDGGTVRVRLLARKRDVVLTVSNPCEDLTASDTRRLFDRFYRADTSRSRSTGGYGIGLSIAQGIVIRHGGSIRARLIGSELEMRVTLPRK